MQPRTHGFLSIFIDFYMNLFLIGLNFGIIIDLSFYLS